MRKRSVLEALFPSVRRRLLATTLLEPDKWWYLTELAAQLKTAPSSLQRELLALTRSDLLELRRDGRRTYYKANTASPVFAELSVLFNKTVGVVPTLRSELRHFEDRITWAFLYGSTARDEEQSHSDIDLMVVGSVSMPQLLPALRRLEEKFGREINVTRYSDQEFEAKIRNHDHFLLSVLNREIVMIKGLQDELAATTRRAQSSVAHH
jgi:predicted nucleotidyltransferase